MKGRNSRQSKESLEKEVIALLDELRARFLAASPSTQQYTFDALDRLAAAETDKDRSDFYRTVAKILRRLAK